MFSLFFTLFSISIYLALLFHYIFCYHSNFLLLTIFIFSCSVFLSHCSIWDLKVKYLCEIQEIFIDLNKAHDIKTCQLLETNKKHLKSKGYFGPHCSGIIIIAMSSLWDMLLHQKSYWHYSDGWTCRRKENFILVFLFGIICFKTS